MSQYRRGMLPRRYWRLEAIGDMGLTMWGYLDADKKRKPLDKIRNAMEEYRYRHGHDATHCRLHGSLIAELPNPPLVLIAHSIPWHSFFLSVEEVTP